MYPAADIPVVQLALQPFAGPTGTAASAPRCARCGTKAC
jgi:aromatic ring-opening dioxygenase catalytic subunit (LigB family)